MSLFRKEAIAHQSERLTGVITLAQPLSLKITVILLTVIAILIVSFLFTANYARKETVRGFLVPNKGVIKSFASQGGTIEKLWVVEGDFIKQGSPLATLVVHQGDASGVDLSEQLISQLNQQLNLLDHEIEQHQTLQQQEIANLIQHQQALRNERWALKQQYTLANEKLQLLDNQQQQFNELNKKGYLSDLEKERQQHVLLAAKQDKQALARLLLQQQTQLSQLAFKQKNIPQQYILNINSLKRKQADIHRQLAQTKNQHRYTVTASHSGFVTGIQVVAGENLSPTKAQRKPLLHILPEGSELVAELLLPTRSVGFIQTGHKARLRFDAFPYQRFGFIESEISRIDQTLISPNEVQLPIALQEPVYRIRALLTKQQIVAYGKDFTLKSGMLFEADIMLEQRSLIEWLLAPLYSLSGRIS